MRRRCCCQPSAAWEGEVALTVQTHDSLRVVEDQPMQEWRMAAPEDLRQQWQALEHIGLYLDKIGQETEARYKSQQPGEKCPACRGGGHAFGMMDATRLAHYWRSAS